jgi:hypothetical protein
MSETSIPNPHDSFFKQTFARVDVARDALQRFLPSDVLACLDLKTLVPAKDSFIDDDLRQSFSDLVFEIELFSGEPAMVCLLLEHKSESDRLTGFQTLKYVVRINERRLRDKLPLCCVIPLVVYHGPSEWTAPLDVHDLIACPPALARFVPRFRYELLDLGTYSDETFRGDAFAEATLLTLKYILRPALRDRLPTIVELIVLLMARPGGRNDVLAFLRYLTVGTKEVDLETLKITIKQNFKTDGELLVSTIAEQWVQEGLEKGELIGQIRAFQEVLGLEVQTLESLGSLDRKKLESEVSRLRQKLGR